MHEEAPDGAELRDPAGKRKKKLRGHLTGIGIWQECHADGHEKLAKQALRMGGVGIPIYGIREHGSGAFALLKAVPNDRDECTIGHVYLDFIEENGFSMSSLCHCSNWCSSQPVPYSYTHADDC